MRLHPGVLGHKLQTVAHFLAFRLCALVLCKFLYTLETYSGSKKYQQNVLFCCVSCKEACEWTA